MLFFTKKYLIRYTSKLFFEEYNFKKILLEEMWSYTCSKFRESYTPPAIRIRVKNLKGPLKIQG
jgi:hypothetical protein